MGHKRSAPPLSNTLTTYLRPIKENLTPLAGEAGDPWPACVFAIVSHRPCTGLQPDMARGPSVASTLQRAGRGPNSWICARDTSSIPAEREREWASPPPPFPLPAASYYLHHCKDISSPVCYHRGDTLGDCRPVCVSIWAADCTQPVWHAATLTHNILSHTLIVIKTQCTLLINWSMTPGVKEKINSNFYTQAKWILSVRGHECPSSQQTQWATLRKKKKSHNYTRTTDAHMSSYKLLTAKLVVLIINQMMTFNTTRDLREKSEKRGQIGGKILLLLLLLHTWVNSDMNHAFLLSCTLLMPLQHILHESNRPEWRRGEKNHA